MGPCATKDKVSTPKSPYHDNNNSNNRNKPKKSHSFSGKYGIKNNSQQQKLSFCHSPLTSCQFLFNKFKKSDGSPEEVTLGFMLSKCTIDKEKKEIHLSHINSVPMKIWVIYGGIQKVSQTGLTLQITQCKQLQQIRVQKSKQLSSQNNKGNNQSGSYISPVHLLQSPNENILIVLEPQLQNQQTIFMIYRYQIIPQERQYTLITQSLQWSSLSFKINDIYGSETLFKCNDQNQVCSICLTNQSQCILLPCRHMCVCSGCLEQVQKTKPQCPLCRKQYYSFIKYQSSEQN